MDYYNMKINLGSGTDYRKGWINIEVSKDVRADYYLDVAKEVLPFADGSIDHIEAIDLFEHILYPIFTFNECWRVLRKNGTMYIEVPYGGTEDYYKDPTHVRPFIPKTFKYFAEWNTSPAYGIKTWEIIRIHSTLGGENQNRIYVTMRKP